MVPFWRNGTFGHFWYFGSNIKIIIGFEVHTSFRNFLFLISPPPFPYKFLTNTVTLWHLKMILFTIHVFIKIYIQHSMSTWATISKFILFGKYHPIWDDNSLDSRTDTSKESLPRLLEQHNHADFIL